MYDELLPPVLLQTETNRQLLSGERPWTVKPVPAIELNALLRAAKIAGKRDAERATRIFTGGLSFQMQLIDFRRLPPGERSPSGSVIGMSDEQRVQLPALRETHEPLRGEILAFSDLLSRRV